MTGLHLTNLDNTPHLGHRPLTEAERAYQRDVAAWDEVERGYSAIQSTRPLTVAYGLTDSPAGLAAWIVEKWVRWSDSGGDLANLPREVLLTVLTTYWLTGTIGSSMRTYLDNRWSNPPIGPEEYAAVPTALAVFDHMPHLRGHSAARMGRAALRRAPLHADAAGRPFPPLRRCRGWWPTTSGRSSPSSGADRPRPV